MPATPRTTVPLAALSGILGTVALTLYFSAPFTWMPLPPPNATEQQLFTFGSHYHTQILWDTWLQQAGTFLSVAFALGLVYLAGRSASFAGRLTLLVSAVLVSLSLAEGTFELGAAQSGANGHLASAVTCFELTNVFIHIFLLAPSLFLVLGFALKGSQLLPRFFVFAALSLGVLFQTLGVVALFNEHFLLAVIAVLMLQNLWSIAASIALLTRRNVTVPVVANAYVQH